MSGRLVHLESGAVRAILAIPCLLGLLGTSAAAEGTGGTGDLARVLTGLEPEAVGVPLRALAIVTVLSVVPSVILLATSFPRILIVLSFLRKALGTQDLPPNQVLAGLTLLLTVIVMTPVWKRIHDEAYLPLKSGEIRETTVAVDRAARVVKEFMLAHAFEEDVRLFLELSARGQEPRAPGSDPAAGSSGPRAGQTRPDVDDLGFFVVLPAFVVSELKVAFQMGFLLYLPFLVIDLAVSAVLISMGMFMLPPTLISLPVKVLVFVLADGWSLVVEQMVVGFRTAVPG